MPDDGNTFRPIAGSLYRQAELKPLKGSAVRAQSGEFARALRQQSTLEQTASSKAEQSREARAAEQFEALLLHQMLKSMWQAVPSEGLLSGSQEEGLYRDMFSEAVADEISRTQSLGIKEAVMKDMNRGEKK